MRKGQFYMLDAFFAASILFLGVTLAVSTVVSEPDVVQAQATVIDVNEILFQEEIGELATSYILNNHDILQEELTPAEQVHIWVSNTSCSWCLPNATALLESLVGRSIPAQHGLAIHVNGTEVFLREIDHEPSFRLVDVQLIQTTPSVTTVLGPDPIEVMVWA